MTLKAMMCGVVAALMATVAQADDLKLAVTTSFANSGLADVLLPQVLADTGINVQLVIVGTGQALRLGAAGDVDAVLTHAKAAEEIWLNAGNGTHRREFMYNDFVIVGPAADPAKASTARAATDALANIAKGQVPFVSRGDDSGTHKMEQRLWQLAGIGPVGNWYRSVGQGMGGALNTASGMNAYILSDRASWLRFANKGELGIVFQGDPALFNQYAFLPVNPEQHPHVQTDLAARLEDWLISETAKTLINEYTLDGQRLFTFNAAP